MKKSLLLFVGFTTLLCMSAWAAPTTLSWNPGWDDLGQPLNYTQSNVTYDFLTTTNLQVTYHIVGSNPNSEIGLGIHQFLPSLGACASPTFGQFFPTPGCGEIMRQGNTAIVVAFELGSALSDGSGNADLTVVVNNLLPGTYNLEFNARNGAPCPPFCDVMYQSGALFGDYVTLNVPGVPEPGSLGLLTTAVFSAAFAIRRRLRF